MKPLITIKPLPMTVTETLYISLCTVTGDAVLTSYPSTYNPQLGTTEVTVDVPQLTDQEIYQNQVAALIAQADEIKATTSKRLQEISEQISKLTCIEHQEEQS